MGGQDEQASVATNIVNDALQNVANYCSITCNNNISNQDITIIGGNATINIEQSCSIVGAECQIKNLVDSQISNIINNMTQQEESNLGIFSLIGPASNTNTSITNAIKNQISQLISSTCQQDNNNTITNNTVFAQDANLNLTIGQTGNVNNAQCVLDTVAKLTLNNDVTNTVKQTESSCKDVILILIIIIVIMILFILFPLLRGLSKGLGGLAEGIGSVGKGVGQGAGSVGKGIGQGTGKAVGGSNTKTITIQ
jgi:hypothetical protein